MKVNFELEVGAETGAVLAGLDTLFRLFTYNSAKELNPPRWDTIILNLIQRLEDTISVENLQKQCQTQGVSLDSATLSKLDALAIIRGIKGQP